MRRDAMDVTFSIFVVPHSVVGVRVWRGSCERVVSVACCVHAMICGCVCSCVTVSICGLCPAWGCGLLGGIVEFCLDLSLVSALTARENRKD